MLLLQKIIFYVANIETSLNFWRAQTNTSILISNNTLVGRWDPMTRPTTAVVVLILTIGGINGFVFDQW